MDQNKRFFIKNFLEKSQEALIDAEINIKNNRLDNARNRVYYSIFYSVIALGYSENFITSKHHQLMGWFNKKFIYEEKIFNENMYRTYKDAYENRRESDYTIFTKPVKENVLKSFEEAKKFIEKVTYYIKKNA